ncbi:MAG TPA: DUF1697 domain-containing protein [Sphingomicrobium sp.]|nr:DUF1697 domain-containing protein [Sphingomicrobium sp.]
MTGAVALLRGINVGGHRRVPMAELRALAEQIGLANPRTYVASGNLLFGTDKPAQDVSAELERAIERRFGFAVDVIVRTRSEWQARLQSNPFQAVADEQPKWVWMFLSKQPPRSEAAVELAAAALALRVEQTGDAIWVHFAEGVSTKILTIKWDRIIGSPSTSRNWRTVETIGRMLDEGQIG